MELESETIFFFRAIESVTGLCSTYDLVLESDAVFCTGYDLVLESEFEFC